METIIKWLLVIAAIAVVVYGIVFGYEMWASGQVEEGRVLGRSEVQAKWDADVRQRDTEKLVAVAVAVAQERAMGAAVVKGEKDAREKAEKQAAGYRVDAATARGNTAGLSGNIAALDWAARNIGIPDAASCAGEFEKQRNAAMRARKLLSSCSTEHQALGERVDVAWGNLTLQLDTALGYINTVKPAN